MVAAPFCLLTDRTHLKIRFAVTDNQPDFDYTFFCQKAIWFEAQYYDRRKTPEQMKNLVIMHAKTISYMIICLAMLAGAPAAGLANTSSQAIDKKTVINGSGLDVPRFAALKSNKVNMRVGPGHDYPVEGVYLRKNLPVKVVSEFDVWRKIIDHEGVTGWVHSQLISSKRYAVITAPVARLRKTADAEAAVSAIVEKNVVMELQFCEQGWCRLYHENGAGWALPAEFFGLLENEKLR